MDYELGYFVGVNTDPLVILACLLIVKFQNIYIKVIIYAIAYVAIMKAFFFYTGTYESFFDKDFVYKLIGAILYASIFFAIKSYRRKKDKINN